MLDNKNIFFTDNINSVHNELIASDNEPETIDNTVESEILEEIIDIKPDQILIEEEPQSIMEKDENKEDNVDKNREQIKEPENSVEFEDESFKMKKRNGDNMFTDDVIEIDDDCDEFPTIGKTINKEISVRTGKIQVIKDASVELIENSIKSNQILEASHALREYKNTSEFFFKLMCPSEALITA